MNEDLRNCYYSYAVEFRRLSRVIKSKWKGGNVIYYNILEIFILVKHLKVEEKAQSSSAV